MTDRELMQEALYALTYVGDAKEIYSDTIESLRARLAQPEESDWAAAGFSKPPVRSEQWWKHEVSNAWAEGYEKGRASVKQPEQEIEPDKPCVEGDGCPTEKAVLQRFWREHQAQPERKLWLWKNFVDGRPEYWAFDNPYPTNLDNGDPQTLGQPCGYAIFKPSRDGSCGRTEEQVLHEMKSVIAPPQREDK